MAEKTTKDIAGLDHLAPDGMMRLMRDILATGNLVSVGARYTVTDGDVLVVYVTIPRATNEQRICGHCEYQFPARWDICPKCESCHCDETDEPHDHCQKCDCILTGDENELCQWCNEQE